MPDAEQRAWYTVMHWRQASGSFSYLSDSAWLDSFSARPQLNDNYARLPQLIRLQVAAGNGSQELWLVPGSSSQVYLPAVDTHVEF